MLSKLKKLFTKKFNKVSSDIRGEIDENPIVSNVLDYEYDYNNQKEIKQLYPNNEDIDVILGFWNNDAIEDGHRLSPDLLSCSTTSKASCKLSKYSSYFVGENL